MPRFLNKPSRAALRSFIFVYRGEIAAIIIIAMTCAMALVWYIFSNVRSDAVSDEQALISNTDASTLDAIETFRQDHQDALEKSRSGEYPDPFKAKK